MTKQTWAESPWLLSGAALLLAGELGFSLVAQAVWLSSANATCSRRI